ncbi:MAG TPA: extracellular solute-binding protein [Oscillatoriaceae cyanobacterium M33_DOE_052]|uniref:Extracellular solute-binding protein n=1 Tax=Planktothricoides sp. SpSt-374 TaxID=2282167 RepID=A0A7C3VMX1_9CYAN|nr:extracellular solute-binding protein [Oscillatoriaceae cyanobacterium M33_DOE_052]
MKRRHLIGAASTIVLSQLAGGCGQRVRPTLRVRLLKNSIPPILLRKFRQTQPSAVVLDFAPAAQLQDLFASLQKWQQNQPGENYPQLVTMGDYWLKAAIEQKLIQPLDPQKLTMWEQLAQPWQELVRRDDQGNLAKDGPVWGAPYRWGTTAIAYRRDKFKPLGWEPTDWSDLWRPELRDRISLPNHPREVIGLTLKKLGHSYNTENLANIPKLKAELQQLHSQVKFYSTDAYLEPLIIGDTWLAVGSSTDILRVMERQSQIKAVIPASGTAIWADLWVQPTPAAKNTSSEPNQNLPYQWIDFCWQPEVAPILSLISDAASPLLTTTDRQTLPESLQQNAALLPAKEIIDKSEFIQQYPPEITAQYTKLWQEIRGL